VVAFHVDGTPQAQPVRDPATGLVVDGYRFVVVSNETGNRAVIDVPAVQMSPAKVAELANAQLGQLDATTQQYSKPPVN
jgi:hypothetical protein